MNAKKTIFKSIFSLFLLAAVVIACSDDTAMHELNNENNTAGLEARGSYWDGIIAHDRGNGNYEFAVDPQLLIDDMEVSLEENGIPTTLVSLTIVEKTATNNPNDHGYMLIGTDHAGTSMGYMLELENTAFRMSKGFGSGTGSDGISCKGCTDGCNIMYFTHADGSKSPYCNENGCSTYDCKEIK